MRDLDAAGTLERDWQGLELPTCDLATVTASRLVVVAPHPDDEVLAAGGTVAQLAARGLEVVLVAVTDGEASHPRRADDLRARRPVETLWALAELDVTATVHRLGHPDGGVEPHRLATALQHLLGPGDLVLAPWEQDGHPDHDVVGATVRDVCDRLGVTLWAYPVWTWHWADRGTPEIPWADAFAVALPPDVVDRKRAAIAAFATQLEGPDPILPAGFVAHFTRPYEVFWTA